jgi:opacity protein-like surface antigen
MSVRITLGLAGLVALGCGAPALSADLGLPPPAQIMDGGNARNAIAELGTGWYLRGDVGYTVYDKPREAAYSALALPPLQRKQLSDPLAAGGGFGYKFNNWFRADLTADIRYNSSFRALSSATNFVEGYSIDRARLNANSFLLNGYVDLGTWWGFTPYIGAGVGYSQMRLGRYTGQVYCLTTQCGDPNPAASYTLGPQTPTGIPAGVTWNLAWALMAGAAIDVMPNLKIDAGYRYINLGYAKTKFDRFGVGTKFKPLDAHEFRVGLRYMID